MRLGATATHGRPKDAEGRPPGDAAAGAALTPKPSAANRNAAQGSTVGYAARAGARGGEDNPHPVGARGLVGTRLDFGPLRGEGPGATAGHHGANPGGPEPGGATHGGDGRARAPRRDGLEGPGGVEGGSRDGVGEAGEYPDASPGPADKNAAGHRPAASPPPQLPAPPPAEGVTAVAVVVAGSDTAAATNDEQPPPPLPQQAQHGQPPAPGGGQRSAAGPTAGGGSKFLWTMRIGASIMEIDESGERVGELLMKKARAEAGLAGSGRGADRLTLYARREGGADLVKFPGIEIKQGSRTTGKSRFGVSRTVRFWRLYKTTKLRETLGLPIDALVTLYEEVGQDGEMMVVVEPAEWYRYRYKQPAHFDEEVEEAGPQGAQPEQQQQEQQGLPDGEGGDDDEGGEGGDDDEEDEGNAGPAGLFDAGGARRGSEGAGTERPGKRQRLASSDADDEDDEGALPSDEAPPVPHKPVGECTAVAQGSMRIHMDVLVAALREAKAKAAALEADKAALEGIRAALAAAEARAAVMEAGKAALEQHLAAERKAKKAAEQQLQVTRAQLEKAEADGAALEQQLRVAKARAAAAEQQLNQEAEYLASVLQQEGLSRAGRVAQQQRQQQ